MSDNVDNNNGLTPEQVIARCVEHDYNRTFHDTGICAINDLRRAGYAVVPIPTIAHKGPHDTDASMLRVAADKAEGARYAVGGSVANAAEGDR